MMYRLKPDANTTNLQKGAYEMIFEITNTYLGRIGEELCAIIIRRDLTYDDILSLELFVAASHFIIGWNGPGGFRILSEPVESFNCKKSYIPPTTQIELHATEGVTAIVGLQVNQAEQIKQALEGQMWVSLEWTTSPLRERPVATDK